MSRCSLIALPFALLAACTSTETGNRRDTMTQRQKDSVLGQSGLPGAQAVTKAQRAADSAKARQAQTDTGTPP